MIGKQCKEMLILRPGLFKNRISNIIELRIVSTSAKEQRFPIARQAEHLKKVGKVLAMPLAVLLGLELVADELHVLDVVYGPEVLVVVASLREVELRHVDLLMMMMMWLIWMRVFVLLLLLLLSRCFNDFSFRRRRCRCCRCCRRCRRCCQVGSFQLLRG